MLSKGIAYITGVLVEFLKYFPIFIPWLLALQFFRVSFFWGGGGGGGQGGGGVCNVWNK